MNRMFKGIGHTLLAAVLVLATLGVASADNIGPVSSVSALTQPQSAANPLLIPKAPDLDAKGYILIDASTGKILAQKDANRRLAPASLTKMMTLYIIAEALKSGRIHLTDKVTVSKKAWRMGGSKMFIKVGQRVRVKDLIKGIVIVSGNDSCVAMAEDVAGTEAAFVSIMNQQAKALGMTHTHFTDCTGMPHPDHYSTPHDLAILARALIHNHPKFYHMFFADKWFEYNGIKQPNRNRLLWRDAFVDGVKTGHTKEAGYCLVSSGVKNGMRLISVVMGTPTDMARAEESQRLLTYGFRFFENHRLYSAGHTLTSPRVWMGLYKTVPVGIAKDIVVTIPAGSYKDLKAVMTMENQIRAPVNKLTTLGDLKVMLNGKTIAQSPLVALQNDPKGGLWTRVKDYVSLTFHRIFSKDKNKKAA